jgi:hypothetical protein
MMLVDSNIIVCAASGNYPALLEWFLDNKMSASAISLVEALGYHKLKPPRKICAGSNLFGVDHSLSYTRDFPDCR